MKDVIWRDGLERNLRDVMNPPGMFLGGKRQREYSATSDPLPSSGKLIPEFFGRRNIWDMFARKPSLLQSQSNGTSSGEVDDPAVAAASQGTSTTELFNATHGVGEQPLDTTVAVPASSPSSTGKKRSAPSMTSSKSTKRGKSGSAVGTPPVTSKGQQSLKGFFKPNATLDLGVASAILGRTASQTGLNDHTVAPALRSAADLAEAYSAPEMQMEADKSPHSANKTPRNAGPQPNSGAVHFANASPTVNFRAVKQPQELVHDPIESKESWSRLFAKPAAPRCEGHEEPCVSLLTKKPGMNLGRSFWMCPRPLGPSGAKEKNTQWRCQTFIWCSDWNPTATIG